MHICMYVCNIYNIYVYIYIYLYIYIVCKTIYMYNIYIYIIYINQSIYFKTHNIEKQTTQIKYPISHMIRMIYNEEISFEKEWT